MTRVLIVGAGQSGLRLAHYLRDSGIDVDLMTNRTSNELRFGPAVPSQLTLPSTLDAERAAGLNFWSDDAEWQLGLAPEFRSVHLATAQDGETTGFIGNLPGPGIAVDPRLSQADLLEAFEDKGGRPHIKGATVSDLDYFAAHHHYDLIIVAVGTQKLGEFFTVDAGRRVSPTDKRTVSQVYVDGVTDGDADVDVLSTADGEVFLHRVLTAYGTVHSLQMIGVPGGAFDTRPDPDERHVDIHAAILERLKTHAPDLHARCVNAVLIDPSSAIHTTIRPAVRHPVGILPSGGAVLGMGDTVLTVDPSSGQGAAASTLAATIYADRILAHGGRPFDAAWMRETFDAYWQSHGRAVAGFVDMVNLFHSGELDPQVLALFAQATQEQEKADWWIGSMDSPTAFADQMPLPS